jgi:hypothetical protein
LPSSKKIDELSESHLEEDCDSLRIPIEGSLLSNKKLVISKNGSRLTLKHQKQDREVERLDEN